MLSKARKFIGTTVENTSIKKNGNMMVFSTVLEVNGNPVVYSVYKNSNLAFFNPYNKIKNAPILLATLLDTAWDIKGTQDPVLVNQVIKEIAA